MITLIKDLNVGPSEDFSNLISLDISNNPLVHIFKMAFKPVLAIKVLHTKDINFHYFDKTVFQGIFLESLHANDFHWNCLISTVKVKVKVPWYRSCSNLLLDNVIKHFFIYIPILILGFNILCATINLLGGEQGNRCYTTTISISMIYFLGYTFS